MVKGGEDKREVETGHKDDEERRGRSSYMVKREM